MVASTYFDPDPSRIAARDALWRSRLATSFAYLAETLANVSDKAGPALSSVSARLEAGPVSPWVTVLYSKLVRALSAGEHSEIDAVLAGMVEASTLDPANDRPLRLGDPLYPDPWWSQFRILLDTDSRLPFRPAPADDLSVAACSSELAAAFDVMSRADPAFCEETSSLIRLTVLGQTATALREDDFGACSSFFLREAVLVNAAKRRGPLLAADMLIHEASHVLLFSIAAEQPLTNDRGQTRRMSAARPDPRPVDGIFHACFVSTRVHLAMSRMLDGGRLTEDETKAAIGRRSRNREIALSALAALEEYSAATPTGLEVLSELAGYWSEHRAMAD